MDNRFECIYGLSNLDLKNPNFTIPLNIKDMVH